MERGARWINRKYKVFCLPLHANFNEQGNKTKK